VAGVLENDAEHPTVLIHPPIAQPTNRAHTVAA